MRAAFLTATGSPDVIRVGDLPTPDPLPGQVRVKVAASSVNPIDVYIRSGAVSMPLPTPFVPGCDFAGVVDAVGAGVSVVRPGDRVWGSNQGLLGRQGAFAEYCCPDERFVYPLAETVPFAAAAAVALVGITAHLGLFRRANLQPGETVFVNGGAGGVGAMVVQMAKLAGATVVATAGTDANLATARRLGADHAISYKSPTFTDEVKTAAPNGIDVWYETQPPTDLDRTVELMAANGRVVVMAGRAARPAFPNGPFYVKGLSLVGFAMFNTPAAEQRAAADAIGGWLAAGRLQPLIGRTVPLTEAAAAHRLQEENTLGKAGTLAGKIVVQVG